MKALLLPHKRRAELFLPVMQFARESRGWDVGVVCSEQARRAYADVADPGNLFFVPDFHSAEVTERPTDAEQKALIKECERSTGISAGRIVLAGARDIGRGFGLPSHYWIPSAVARAAMRDNAVPLRVVAAMFSFMNGVLSRFQPDLVVAGHAASPLLYTTLLLAEWRGIPFVMGRPSRILSNRSYWTRNRGMFNDEAFARYSEKARTAEDVSEYAKGLISEFREKPATVQYILDNWKRGGDGRWRKAHGRFAASVVAHVAHRVRKRKGVRPKPALSALLDFYRSEYLRWRHSGRYETWGEDELQGRAYIYFPMHKEPELAINYQAPFWHNQLNTVACLAAVLPAGFRLLVREHRFNNGRRPTRFYRDLAALPNVSIIHPLDSQFKYISNADLIVTENGSTGWEGLLLGRPVVTLSDTMYDPPELARRVRDVGQLNEVVLDALANPPATTESDYDRRLGWMIDAERESTQVDGEEDYELALDMITQLADAGGQRERQGHNDT